LSNKKKE